MLTLALLVVAIPSAWALAILAAAVRESSERRS